MQLTRYRHSDYSFSPMGEVFSHKRNRYLRVRTNQSGHHVITVRMPGDAKPRCYSVHKICRELFGVRLPHCPNKYKAHGANENGSTEHSPATDPVT